MPCPLRGVLFFASCAAAMLIASRTLWGESPQLRSSKSDSRQADQRSWLGLLFSFFSGKYLWEVWWQHRSPSAATQARAAAAYGSATTGAASCPLTRSHGQQQQLEQRQQRQPSIPQEQQ